MIVKCVGKLRCEERPAFYASGPRLTLRALSTLEADGFARHSGWLEERSSFRFLHLSARTPIHVEESVFWLTEVRKGAFRSIVQETCFRRPPKLYHAA